MSAERQVIVKSLVNGTDMKRFRLASTKLTAGSLLDQICAQHAGLERGKFTTKLEVKGRPALEPLGTQVLRDAFAAAGGDAASSVVLRLFSFDDRPAHEASVANEDWHEVVWSGESAPNAAPMATVEYRAPFGARICDLLCFGQQVAQLNRDPSRVRASSLRNAASSPARAGFQPNRRTGSNAGLQ